MEKFFTCQFEEHNMDSSEFDPVDYCGSEYTCQFKSQYKGKRVCMKQPETQVVTVMTTASMEFSVMTIEGASALVANTLTSTVDKVDLRTPDWFVSVDTSVGVSSVGVYARGPVPEELRVVLRSAF